ncbi:hypothetical protein SLEP1_g31987 [Rubroshorea leprosula]|uniref:Uncharacterized protein n=1 Tax=Rubroshorea leprosula TaxID=152421 RepID=A0AAV5KC04_9ROSI|nr:hypothetical protein SLEP1_g31987 [Rubroshorea leprosula]
MQWLVGWLLLLVVSSWGFNPKSGEHFTSLNDSLNEARGPSGHWAAWWSSDAAIWHPSSCVIYYLMPSNF